MAFDYFFGNCQSQTGTIRLGSKKRFKDLLLRMQMNSMNGRTSFFISSSNYSFAFWTDVFP